MSDTETKPTEQVLGAITGITQKATDKWQVHVQPDGSQYAKNLWTKDGELVSSLSALIGQTRAFACGVSEWTNQDGKPVRSLWINSVSETDGTPPTPTPSVPATNVPATASGNVQPAPPLHAPVLGGDKDRVISRLACLKAAAQVFSGAMNAGEPIEEVRPRILETAASFERWVYRDLGGDDLPF